MGRLPLRVGTLHVHRPRDGGDHVALFELAVESETVPLRHVASPKTIASNAANWAVLKLD